jgi:hypothetical protein
MRRLSLKASQIAEHATNLCASKNPRYLQLLTCGLILSRFEGPHHRISPGPLDDAQAAYSYAAPAIQGMFRQADIFMDMVRNGYTPVYRHRSFEFGEAQAADGKIAQRVHIVDADGVPWEALYTLEVEPDGSVRISGCVLLKTGQGV